MSNDSKVLNFGAYFAVLPALPSIPPRVLKEACDNLVISGFECWTHYRFVSMRHPQLKDPLQYLEISGRITSTKIATDIIESLMQNSSIIGNAEILLMLPDTPIPLLNVSLPLDENAETFADYGLVGMKGALSDVNAFYDYSMNEFHRLYDALQDHKDARNHFKEIMMRDKYRFDFRLDLDPEGLWRHYEQNGRWKSLVENILGSSYRLVKCGCVLSLPSCETQYWHSDGVHLGPSLEGFESTNQASSAHAICVFVPLIDLNESTGYTEFWAGSHKYSKLLQKKGEQCLPGGTLGLLSKGDALLYDYRTIHRGTSNTSSSIRPVAYFLYAQQGFEFVEDQNFVNESVFEFAS
jgi:Phytanoyl-CoA dioxygenase (PhyH)